MKVGDRARLTRVISDHTILRTDEVIGTLTKVPSIGSNLILIGKSLCEDLDYRHVQTSDILSMEVDNEIWTLRTRNITYKLEIL